MKILLATLLLALAGFAQPFIRPSFAYISTQTGTVGMKQARQAQIEYVKYGCTYIGITEIDEQTANVWCVQVEVLY